MNQEQILQIILEYINLNRNILAWPKNQPITPLACLYGDDGILDSLHLVHLIVGVEREVKKNGYPNLILANSKAFSFHKSPFRTPESLSQYIAKLIQS